jgi:hypothetical protein
MVGVSGALEPPLALLAVVEEDEYVSRGGRTGERCGVMRMTGMFCGLAIGLAQGSARSRCSPCDPLGAYQ